MTMIERIARAMYERDPTIADEAELLPLAQAALEAMIIDHSVGMSEAMANAFHDGTWFDGDTLIVPEVNMWNNAIKAAIGER